MILRSGGTVGEGIRVQDIEAGDGAPPPRASGHAAARLIGLVDGHRLSPTQLRIARYLVDNLPDAVFLSSGSING